MINGPRDPEFNNDSYKHQSDRIRDRSHLRECRQPRRDQCPVRAGLEVRGARRHISLPLTTAISPPLVSRSISPGKGLSTPFRRLQQAPSRRPPRSPCSPTRTAPVTAVMLLVTVAVRGGRAKSSASRHDQGRSLAHRHRTAPGAVSVLRQGQHHRQGKIVEPVGFDPSRCWPTRSIPSPGSRFRPI